MNSDPSHQAQQDALAKDKKRLLQLLLEEEGLGKRLEEHIPRRGPSVAPVASFAQERLWFLEQWNAESCLYNIPVAVRLKGAIQATQLERSLNEVVRRHEGLSSIFTTQDGHVKLAFVPQEITLSQVDLRFLSALERETLLHTLIRSELQLPFDLARGPLLRSVLVQLAKDEYVYLVVLHHIIFDDWSWHIFWRELSACYAAFCEGKHPRLPALPLQYADFAQWQRQQMEGEKLATLLAYWRQQLAGDLPLLQLPTDHPRPPIATFAGSYLSLTLSRALSEGIRLLSRREGVTPFITLLTAYSALLYRHTGQSDILVGSPVVQRDRAEIEELIGYFGNMLVLRVGPGEHAAEQSFIALLKRVQHICLDAFAQQELPFEKLVEDLQPDRSTSHTPLFQTVFSLRSDAHPDVQLKGVQVERFDIERTAARFDLTMEVVETSGVFDVTLTYKTDLFEAATIRRILDHFQLLLEAVVARPEIHIAAVPLVTEEEAAYIKKRNIVEAQSFFEQGVHRLFELQAARVPSTPAILYEDVVLSYAEVNRRANQLARYLRKQGVGPEQLVAVCLERSPDVVLLLLSVLKAGGAFLLLDPSYPQERLNFILADSEAPFLVVQQSTRERISHGQSAVITLDDAWQESLLEPDQNLAGGANTENLAYVVYTSGSTGVPKGVMLPHRALSNRVQAVCSLLQLTEQDRFLHKTPYAFDVSIGEIFTPLVAGAGIVVARPEGHWKPDYLLQCIIRYRVTYVHFVPSMLRVFLEQDLSLADECLKHVWCGGETLPLNLQKRYFQCLHAKLYNGYGPTETGIGVTCCVCDPKQSLQRVSIGRPMVNTWVYILDAALHPVPIGVTGELYIGGVQVARGYLKREDLTQERFMRDPWSEQGGSMYRTGDLARYLNDGSIEFLGRIDDQVKIRGVRIELAEIETVLQQYPAVAQALVLAKEDISGDKYLVAYVVPGGDRELELSELRSILLKRLPEYMVPSAFTRLDALPLMANGKVDQAKLPLPTRTHMGTEKNYIAPRSQTEATIAAIWRELLGIEKVGVHDNFFDLGGYSLLMFQVQRKLRETLQEELSIVELFQSPTIHALAQYIDRHKNDDLTRLRDVQAKAGRQKAVLSRQRVSLEKRFKEMADEPVAQEES